MKNVEIHITLPDPGDHRNHLPGEISRLSQPLDEAVISKTHGLVHDGVRSIDEMKRHLRLFVQEHNQTEDTTISELNRRYYPTLTKTYDTICTGHFDFISFPLKIKKILSTW